MRSFEAVPLSATVPFPQRVQDAGRTHSSDEPWHGLQVPKAWTQRHNCLGACFDEGIHDVGNLELNVTRSIWHQVVGNCKTEASAKPVPMDSYMAEDLLRWRRQSDYAPDDDFVFASETMKGKQPYWPDNLMKRHIRPVARANGINKNIGWHTFRHSFGTLLKANGEDVKTVQELLRHANSRITLDVYTQALSTNKRAAQSKVVKMMVPNLGEMKDEKHSQNGR